MTYNIKEQKIKNIYTTNWLLEMDLVKKMIDGKKKKGFHHLSGGNKKRMKQWRYKNVGCLRQALNDAAGNVRAWARTYHLDCWPPGAWWGHSLSGREITWCKQLLSRLQLTVASTFVKEIYLSLSAHRIRFRSIQSSKQRVWTKQIMNNEW